jgi:hypothetical protein
MRLDNLVLSDRYQIGGPSDRVPNRVIEVVARPRSADTVPAFQKAAAPRFRLASST